MTSISERVRTLLESLGDTPDAVADSLRAQGITGLREDPCHCPIANLIRREFPESDAQGWTYDPDDDPGWFVCQTEVYTSDGKVKPPYPVAEFIAHFDGYPASLRYDDLRAES